MRPKPQQGNSRSEALRVRSRWEKQFHLFIFQQS